MMSDIICDRCGREMRSWEIVGIDGVGGHCTCCGDNLCAVCAGKWSEDGQCEKCKNEAYENMTLEELEFSLPIDVWRKERREMFCPWCKEEHFDPVHYEQRIIRIDSFLDDWRTRSYEIDYRSENTDAVMLKTGRHESLREALFEAHKLLDRSGLSLKGGIQ
jgi:hypothetical protein